MVNVSYAIAMGTSIRWQLVIVIHKAVDVLNVFTILLGIIVKNARKITGVIQKTNHADLVDVIQLVLNQPNVTIRLVLAVVMKIMLGFSVIDVR